MNLLCVSPTQAGSPLVSCGSEPTTALLVAADMRVAAEVAQYAGCGQESATAVGANRRGLDQLLILEKDLIREKNPPCTVAPGCPPADGVWFGKRAPAVWNKKPGARSLR